MFIWMDFKEKKKKNNKQNNWIKVITGNTNQEIWYITY